MPTLKEDRKHLRKSELEVVRLRAQGLTPPEIAEELGISIKTVETHMNAARKVLGCKTIPHLTAEYARRYEDHICQTAPKECLNKPRERDHKYD